MIKEGLASVPWFPCGCAAQPGQSEHHTLLQPGQSEHCTLTSAWSIRSAFSADYRAASVSQARHTGHVLVRIDQVKLQKQINPQNLFTTKVFLFCFEYL